MEQKGVNQKELAHGTNIHSSLISKLLKDHRRWNMDQIQAVAKFFGVSEASLLNGSPYAEPEKPIAEQIETVISAAESENLKEKIAPKRMELSRRLLEHFAISNERPSVPLIRKILPFLLSLALVLSPLPLTLGSFLNKTG